jgi:hypothetical protein
MGGVKMDKRLSIKNGDILHIETPNGIVTIRAGLTDRLYRKVDSVKIIPDNYAGDNKIKLVGLHNTRLIRLKRKV